MLFANLLFLFVFLSVLQLTCNLKKNLKRLIFKQFQMTSQIPNDQIKTLITVDNSHVS